MVLIFSNMMRIAKFSVASSRVASLSSSSWGTQAWQITYLDFGGWIEVNTSRLNSQRWTVDFPLPCRYSSGILWSWREQKLWFSSSHRACSSLPSAIFYVNRRPWHSSLGLWRVCLIQFIRSLFILWLLDSCLPRKCFRIYLIYFSQLAQS